MSPRDPLRYDQRQSTTGCLQDRERSSSAIARTLGHLLVQRGIRTIGLRRARRDDAGDCWTRVIDTSVDGWREELRALGTAGTLDVAFDYVGGYEGAALAECLRRGGTLVHYGLLSGQSLPPSLWQNRPDLNIELVRLREWVHSAEKQQLLAAFSQVFDLIRDGVVKTRVQEELPLEKVAAGIKLALTRASQGKVLLRPGTL